MNLKKLFLMLTFFVLLGTTAFAQTTFYVNSISGLDGYNGLSATVQGGGVGPKLTIQNAVDAAVDGDIISIAGNALQPYAGAVVTGNKTLTFTATAGAPAGTPLLNGNFTVNDNAGNADDGATFTGNLFFGDNVTFYLQNGKVTGAGFLNFVGVTATANTIRRAANTNTFDVAPTTPNAASVNLVYDNAAITVGNEWTSTTAIKNVTSSQAGTTLTLGASRTMNGVLTTTGGGTLAIGANVLTLNNPTTATTLTHTNAGTITSSGVNSGELKFTSVSTTAHHTWAGVGNIPTVRKSSTSNLLFNAVLTTINGNLIIDAVAGNLTFTPGAAQALAITGSVTHNGSGQLLFDPYTTLTLTGSLTNAGTGKIIYANTVATIGGDVVNSGSLSYTSNSAPVTFAITGHAAAVGNVVTVTAAAHTYAVGDVVIITGNADALINGVWRIKAIAVNTFDIEATALAANAGNAVSAGSASTVVNRGGITFGNANHAITGSVLNSKSIAVNVSTATGLSVTDVGNIYFGMGNITISGNLTNSTNLSGSRNSSSTLAAETGVTNSGNITFASTTNTTTVTGAVSLQSQNSFDATPGTNEGTGTFTNNGNIVFAATSGNLSFGSLTNNSSGYAYTAATPMGSILSLGAGARTLGVVNITNTSANTSGNGMIDFTGSTGTNTITGSVGISGASGTGDIIFGTGTTNITGNVTNSKSVTGTVVTFLATANNVTITGLLSISNSGVVTSASTGGTIGAGSFSQTGGTFNPGAAGSAVTTTVTGGFVFTGGTIALGTVAKTLILNGASSEFSIAATITSTINTNQMTFSGTVAQTATVSSGGTFVWPGHLTINNGIVPGANAWNLQSGNLMANGNVTFTDGQVNIYNNYLFVKGAFANNNVLAESYVTGVNGFISMQNGGGGSVITKSDANNPTFANFEVDNTNNATFGDVDGTKDTYTFTGAFNLTLGAVTGAADGANTDVIVFNNATTYPTIYRNNGTFAAAPDWASGSLLNVSYIGASKTFAFEVPPTATAKLNNMTIATTGAGTVTSNTNFTVFGTLTVNSGQTLDLAATVLTMNTTPGASASKIILLGGSDILGTAASAITLSNPTGTSIEGSSSTAANGNLIPEVLVNTNSVGNIITGIRSISTATGDVADLTVNNGASITLSFVNQSGVADPPANIEGNFTTSATTGTVTLSSAVRAGGNYVHAGGTLEMGTNNFRIDGVTNSQDNVAVVNSTGGYLQFMDATGANCVFTVTTGNASIPYLEVNQGAAGDIFQLSGNTFRLDVTNTLLHSQGTIQIGAGGDLVNLRVTGNTYNVADIALATYNNTGIGALQLVPTTGTLTWTLNDPNAAGTAYAIENLTLDGDVTLAGAANGLQILATGTLTHTSGILNFGDNNIEILGAFTRVAGTYVAGNGYMIWNSAGAFTQGTGFSIPNFRVQAALTPASAQNMVVEKNLYLDNVLFTTLVGGSQRLTLGIAGGTIPTVTVVGAGNLSDNPTFAQPMANYTFTGASVAITGHGATSGGGAAVGDVRVTTTNAHNLVVGQTITITGASDAAFNGTYTVTAVAAATTFDVTAAAIVNTPASGGVASVNLVTVTNTSRYWPSTNTTVANDVTVNFLNNADKVLFNSSRTIAGITSLNLTRGILSLNNNIVLTLASGATINKNANATLTLDDDATPGNGTGTFSAENVNLVYTGAQATGAEYSSPTVVTNVTNNSTGGGLLTIGSAKTIAGDLTANHNVTITANTTVAGTISVAANRTLTVTAPATLTVNGGTGSILGTLAGTGSVNFTSQAVTLGAFTNTGTIGFLGATGQTVTVPAGGAALSGMVVNMTGVNPVLNVTGGNLSVGVGTAGIITFINGIIDMGANTLILDRPQVAGNSGLGYSRAGVTGTNVGHVVGKVQRAGIAGDGGALTNGRFEFPVGTLTGQYRPAAITFTPTYVLGNPVSIIVSHVNASPEGTVGLPLDGGNGVSVGNYPAFYWLVSTTPTSVTSTQNFDMDLQANNIGVPYTSDALLRMIRRQDGSATSNAWSMQGAAANYSNYQVVNGTDTTVVVRTVSAQGGLVQQGSRFALGVPSRAPNFTAPVLATFTVAEGATTANTIQFTAVGLNTNDGAITYTKTSGPAWAAIDATTGLVTLTPGYTDYSATAYTLVVRATTASNLVSEKTVTITVTNTDRGPVLAAATETVNPATATTSNGVAKTVTYTATDADGDVVTYAYVVDKAVSTGSVVFSETAGTLTFTPAFADVANSPFTFTVTASSGTPAMTATVTTVFTVTNAGLLGDVNLSGTITSADALLVLNYVVNPTAYPLTAQQQWAADVKVDGVIGAYDAASILVKAGGGEFLPKQVAAAGTVEFGRFTAEKGVFTLPINIENTAGVKSFYSEIQLGNSVEFSGVSSRLPEGWIMTSNFENGTLKIAMAGLTPLTTGSVAFVNLSLIDKESSVSIQGSTMLNDQVLGALNAVKIKEIPSEFSLSQNYPNPFNPTTSIKYAISENARVNLVVYNVLGQIVRTLVNAEQESGYYTVRWDGTNDFGSRVSSGIYIYRISAGNFNSTAKMNLLK